MYYIHEHKNYQALKADDGCVQGWISDLEPQVNREDGKGVATSGHTTSGYGYSVIRHPQT